MTSMSDFDRLAASLREKYRLRSTVGTGGMAHVYAADDLKTGRHVAIKALREERTTPISVRRLSRRSKSPAQLRHPNIVPLCASGTADGLPYYVMPFVEGNSLRARLQRVGRLPMDEALHICDQISAALDYAHRASRGPRDVKPKRAASPGRALVFDFGIASAVTRTENRPPARDAADGDRHACVRESGTGARRDRDRWPKRRVQPGVHGVRDDLRLCAAHRQFAGAAEFVATSRTVSAAVVLPDAPKISPALSAAVSRALAKLVSGPIRNTMRRSRPPCEAGARERSRGRCSGQ